MILNTSSFVGYYMEPFFDPVCYQVCLRANKPAGPYEVNVMSSKETLGIGIGWKHTDVRKVPPFELRENYLGRIPMHQGGIAQIQSGEWSMMNHNSIGRLTCLSPITWVDGWLMRQVPGLREKMGYVLPGSL